MEQNILNMLHQYQCVTDDDYQNALKQIMQQIALLGLWRAKFFEHTAFYGGTALRILYGLDRFSEDLDFSLLEVNDEFELSRYLNAIQSELVAFGFETEVSVKEKSNETAIQSAFLKTNTLQHLILIEAPKAIQQAVRSNQLIKVKLEIDTHPPLGFNTETKSILRPIPFWVKTYCLSDIFAGKISAMLCRQWQNRVKGRDWYDFLWLIQMNTPVHLSHLESRLRAFKFYTDKVELTEGILHDMLTEQINKLDIALAKQDISKFVKNTTQLDGWSSMLFLNALNEIKIT